MSGKRPTSGKPRRSGRLNIASEPVARLGVVNILPARAGSVDTEAVSLVAKKHEISAGAGQNYKRNPDLLHGEQHQPRFAQGLLSFCKVRKS